MAAPPARLGHADQAVETIEHERWRSLVPPGTTRVDIPAAPGARRRLVGSLLAMEAGTWVALCDSRLGSRWRSRRMARSAGIAVHREYLAVPFLHSPSYYVQDNGDAVRYFCTEQFTVSRGSSALVVGAGAMIAVCRVLSLWGWLGAVVPSRITLGVRT
jgi:hypothetical protein